MQYANAPEKMRNNYKQLKAAANVIKKQVLLFVRFRIQGKEKQKIHFTNVNTNNKKVLSAIL